MVNFIVSLRNRNVVDEKHVGETLGSNIYSCHNKYCLNYPPQYIFKDPPQNIVKHLHHPKLIGC